MAVDSHKYKKYAEQINTVQKKPYHHKNLRRVLIEKGIEMVSEEGVKDFSLRKLAIACGVSHGAPYSHFNNKEELLTAMQQYITELFSEELQRTYERHAKERDVIMYLGQAYLHFFLEHPDYFSFLYTRSSILVNLEDNGSDENNYRPFTIFRNVIMQIFEDASFTEQQKKDLVISMWGFVHGITAIATMKNVVYQENWEQKIMDYMNIFRVE